MEPKDNNRKKWVALKALNQLKKKLFLYPAIAGVGLGRDNKNKFVVLVYVNRDDGKNVILGKHKIPKLISVKDSKKGGKTVKVPTQIEGVDRAEIMPAY